MRTASPPTIGTPETTCRLAAAVEGQHVLRHRRAARGRHGRRRACAPAQGDLRDLAYRRAITLTRASTSCVKMSPIKAAPR